MNCSGHCTDTATQSGPARTGFTRAIAGVLAFASAGARGKRPPVGPEGLRRRAFPCRTSRKARAARAAFGASLALMFGATAAVAGEVTDVAFVGVPSRRVLQRGRGDPYPSHVRRDGDGDGRSYLHAHGRSQSAQHGLRRCRRPAAILTLRLQLFRGRRGRGRRRRQLRLGRPQGWPDRVRRVHPPPWTGPSRQSPGTATTASMPWMPRVVDVRLTSNPGADRVYGIADVVEVTATFDESVTASSAALALTVGTESRNMAVANTGGGQTLVFRYTVSPG